MSLKLIVDNTEGFTLNRPVERNLRLVVSNPEPHISPETVEVITDAISAVSEAVKKDRTERKPRNVTRKWGFEYQPRRRRWIGCNRKATIDLEALEGYSYHNGWCVVKRIGGLVVFNTYKYSRTTSEHQWAIRNFIESEGYSIGLEIEAPKGLHDLDSAIRYCEAQIDDLQTAIRGLKSRKEANRRRSRQIDSLRAKIALIRQLIKMDRAEKKDAA